MPRLAARAFVFTLLWLPLAANAAGDPPDSPDQLKKLYDDKQYKELLPKLSKVLSLSGKSADGYDKYQLLMMKGESSLQTKAKASAMDAFKQAAKSTTDHDPATKAAALAILARECSGTMTYVPKTGTPKGDKPEPIDILTDDGRKSAFDALEHDLIARAKPTVEAAKHSTSLPTIMSAARGLADIRTVEFVVDGGDGDVNGLLGDLGNRVCKLLDDDMDATVQHLNADIDVVGKGRNAAGQRQAIGILIKDAHTGEAEVNQVRDIAKQMPTVFGAVTDFKPTEKHADDLHKQIEGLRKDLRDKGWGG